MELAANDLPNDGPNRVLVYMTRAELQRNAAGRPFAAWRRHHPVLPIAERQLEEEPRNTHEVQARADGGFSLSTSVDNLSERRRRTAASRAYTFIWFSEAMGAIA